MPLSQTTSANGPASFAVNLEELEILTYISIASNEAPVSALQRAQINYGAMTVWDVREMVGNNNPGTTMRHDASKYSDGVMAIGIGCTAPMICDAGSTGYIASATSSATQYFAQCSSSVAITAPILEIASASGTAGRLTLTMVPSVSGSAIDGGSSTQAVDSIAVLNFSGGGSAIYRLGAATSGASAATLLSYQGSLTGTVTGSILNSTIADAANLDIDQATTFIAFNAAWSITTAGSRIASASATQSLSAAGMWSISIGPLGSPSLTALSVSNAAVTITVETGLNVHNAYYVNGFPCSAITRLSITQGSVDILKEVSGAAMRRVERGYVHPDKWNQGMISNFGTLAQLQTWAHRAPYDSTASASNTQDFVYMLPFFEFQDALWLNAQRGGTITLSTTFDNLNQLAVASTTSASALTAQLPNTRDSAHSDTGVALSNSDLKFFYQFVYYSQSASERKYFNNLNVMRVIRSITQERSESLAANTEYQTITYDANKLATLLIVAAQLNNDTRPITNGKFDKHSYMRSLNGTPSAASATNIHIPVLVGFDEKYQSTKRCTVDAVNGQAYARFLRGGMRATETGVLYMPYDVLSHTEGYSGQYCGLAPFSTIEGHTVTAQVQAKGPACTVTVEHVHILMASVSNGCLQQLFL